MASVNINIKSSATSINMLKSSVKDLSSKSSFRQITKKKKSIKSKEVSPLSRKSAKLSEWKAADVVEQEAVEYANKFIVKTLTK